MKRLTLFLFLTVLLSCDKDEDEGPSIFIIQAMTNGQWKVSNYDQGTVSRTSDYSTYSFQFKANLTVDAINNGSVVKTGTWTADGNAQTITSNFTSATNPLDLLNGTWNIQSTTWTSVNATQTVNGELRTLALIKL